MGSKRKNGISFIILGMALGLSTISGNAYGMMPNWSPHSRGDVVAGERIEISEITRSTAFVMPSLWAQTPESIIEDEIERVLIGRRAIADWNFMAFLEFLDEHDTEFSDIAELSPDDFLAFWADALPGEGEENILGPMITWSPAIVQQFFRLLSEILSAAEVTVPGQQGDIAIALMINMMVTCGNMDGLYEFMVSLLGHIQGIPSDMMVQVIRSVTIGVIATQGNIEGLGPFIENIWGLIGLAPGDARPFPVNAAANVIQGLMVGLVATDGDADELGRFLQNILGIVGFVPGSDPDDAGFIPDAILARLIQSLIAGLVVVHGEMGVLDGRIQDILGDIDPDVPAEMRAGVLSGIIDEILHHELPE